MSSKLEWSDELGSRSRSAWLLLVREDEVLVFPGTTTKGWVVVMGTSYRKNGKWSHTTYRLALYDGVRAIVGKDGWETGTFAEGLRAATRSEAHLDTWPLLAGALGVSVESSKRFLRAWRPKAAERLDLVEEEMKGLDP